ncbi:hypothetical protein [Nocardiopsis ansamitocini]|uniref:Uncharacterized protein n=1 Tax=Nocardiopsis ansamitocini TaxID=1670832 RepID=A0A9W6P9F4_9ACTN|nr:hypothetical protein [Nocardiopsis ansamitocini]GLU49417.1 hypothetical protein Nans01_37680 [Nocardiopsis ansamitocini]
MPGTYDYVVLLRQDPRPDPLRQWVDLMEVVSGVPRYRLYEVAALLAPIPEPIRAWTPLARVVAEFERFGVEISQHAARHPGVAPGVDDRLLAARAELLERRDREQAYAALSRAARALHHDRAGRAVAGPRALLRRRSADAQCAPVHRAASVRSRGRGHRGCWTTPALILLAAAVSAVAFWLA